MNTNRSTTGEQIKEQFSREGRTFADWARENGFRRADVSRVINGLSRCSRGKCHDIAVKLGMKPRPKSQEDQTP